MDWGDFIDKAEKIATVLGVIIGGSWVYFNSFRGRIFIPRLQLELAGKIVQQDQVQYILATMLVRNVGSSIVELKGRGTGLKVISLRYNTEARGFQNLTKVDTTAFPVLEKHTTSESEEVTVRRVKVIEPSTTINEQKLIAVPKGKFDAFQLELRITAVSGIRGWPDRAWRAIAMVTSDAGDAKE